MPGYTLTEQQIREIIAVINWKRNFRVNGENVYFKSEPDSCTITIGKQGRTGPPLQLPDATPVELTKTSGSDGDLTTAPTWVYTVKNFAGVTLATGVAPAHNRPKGKTMYATYGWARLKSNAWIVFESDECPNLGGCS